MSVWVANQDGGLVVKGIGAKVIVPDDVVVAPTGTKVDATPGDGNSTFSKVTFTNTYAKGGSGGTDPTDPNQQILNISKTVTADAYADMSRYFEFNLWVMTPSAVAYKAYVVQGNEVVTDALNTLGKPVVPETINGKSCPHFLVNADPTPSAVTFSLKSGQSLVFVDMLIGAKYRVTELAQPRYTATAIITTLNQATGNTVKEPIVNANPNTPLSTEVYTGVGNYLIISDALKTDLGAYTANSTAFTNKVQNTSPTGISVDNLPFVMLIVFALVALAGYIVFRTRKTAAKAEK